MTAILSPESIALFSETGDSWIDSSAPDQERPIDWEPDDRVTKIVIGRPPTGDEASPCDVALPADLAQRYQNLTHLHLWQLSSLEQLPELPPKLQCLDVRGGSKLTALPTLPASVENLDLAGCTALRRLPNAPAGLQRLYIDECSSLEEDYLGQFFLQGLDDATVLQEFSAMGCPAIASIKRLPRSLRRLVLENCENLVDVSGLDEFTELNHLNLSNCVHLQSIPAIPNEIQYLQLHGSDRLTQFMGQDIGPYDRGSEDSPNVARRLYSRRKFGGELATAAHAKLLLLGDGRVGKTTLAKRLQWDGLTAEQQTDAQFAGLQPTDGEQFTHKVRFNLWHTRLRLEKDAAAALQQRTASAGIPNPCDENKELPGAIRIWDFGGQEIYHQTHRLFAAEGSVFLILWTEQPIDPETMAREKPPGATDEEWREWNRTRSLDYWLEYVRSMRPNSTDPIRIALVCTRVPQGASHPPWRERAAGHAEEKIDCFYIDSLEETCSANPEYRRLVCFIQEACGAEANRIGIVQPAYFSEVSAYVDQLLGENDAARRSRTRPQHLLVTEPAWRSDLIQRHATTGESKHELDQDDVATITGYLHDAGQIFYLRHLTTPAILVDQEWATDLIYKILRPPTNPEDLSLFNVIKASGGHFGLAVLEDDPHWQQLSTDAERQQILSFMEECGMVVRLLDRHNSRQDRDDYLATEKWLLPPYDGEILRLCETRFDALPADRETVTFSFQGERLNEFEYRSLMAHLGRILGTRGIWFRDGMQAVDDVRTPHWCFQVRWNPESTDSESEASFFGTVDARLTSRQNHLPRLMPQVENVFASDGSPFASRMQQLRREITRLDEQGPWFRDTVDSDFDVAVSSSGADATIVGPMVEALQQAGLRVTHYQLPECRAGERQEVMNYMNSLRRPPCILLFLSDAYLRDNPEHNWYCLYELADAILQVQRKRRSLDRTLVCYERDGDVTSGTVDEVAKGVLVQMERYFRNRYNDLVNQDRTNRTTFGYYDEWARHFGDAADHVGEFFERRGTRGTYSRYTTTVDGWDFTQIVADVQSALGRSQESVDD